MTLSDPIEVFKIAIFYNYYLIVNRCNEKNDKNNYLIIYLYIFKTNNC